MMESVIWICNVADLDINYNNTVDFNDIDEQMNYFMRNLVYTLENNSYLRKHNNIRVSKHYDELELCNYLILRNKVNGKLMFYFIVDKVYISEKTTELIIKLDVIQTYLFDFKTQGLIDRAHVPRWGKDELPNLEFLKENEGLETGEMMLKSRREIFNYEGKGSYIITANDLLGIKGNFDEGVEIPPYPYNNYISKASNQRFEKIWNGVKWGQTRKIFPSVTYAQYVQESGWAGSELSEKYNNCFGIKADSSWSGETVDLPTQEYVNGEWITVTATWRVYSDANESVKDHVKFLEENPRYAENGVFSANTYQEQCQALQSAGYATDPNYADTLIRIIEEYRLYSYD